MTSVFVVLLFFLSIGPHYEIALVANLGKGIAKIHTIGLSIQLALTLLLASLRRSPFKIASYSRFILSLLLFSSLLISELFSKKTSVQIKPLIEFPAFLFAFSFFNFNKFYEVSYTKIWRRIILGWTIFLAFAYPLFIKANIVSGALRVHVGGIDIPRLPLFDYIPLALLLGFPNSSVLYFTSYIALVFLTFYRTLYIAGFLPLILDIKKNYLRPIFNIFTFRIKLSSLTYIFWFSIIISFILYYNYETLILAGSRFISIFISSDIDATGQQRINLLTPIFNTIIDPRYIFLPFGEGSSFSINGILMSAWPFHNILILGSCGIIFFLIYWFTALAPIYSLLRTKSKLLLYPACCSFSLILILLLFPYANNFPLYAMTALSFSISRDIYNSKF